MIKTLIQCIFYQNCTLLHRCLTPNKSLVIRALTGAFIPTDLKSLIKSHDFFLIYLIHVNDGY